jgi:hypothetical protein
MLKVSNVDTVFIYYKTLEGKVTFRSISTASYEITGNTLISENNKHIINNVVAISDFKNGKRVGSYDL